MRFALWGISALALVGLASLAAPAQNPVKKHPHHHLHHALWELRDANAELKKTKHQFGGHRDKAQVAISDAIKQLELVLLYKGDNIVGTPTRVDARTEYKKYKHHPHLHHSVVELRHAHHQLKTAKHNFDGHRKAALHDINIAINEIEAALKHPAKKKKKA